MDLEERYKDVLGMLLRGRVSCGILGKQKRKKRAYSGFVILCNASKAMPN